VNFNTRNAAQATGMLMNADNEGARLRPFYIAVVVWGREFRDYLLEYSLPSLLSPRNIPALDGRRPVKVLFATTAEDWEAIRRTAIFSSLEQHAESLYLELPPKGDRPYWSHSIVGHKMCCELAARDKAYRIWAEPDAIFSDGTVEFLHDTALNGAQAVLKLAMPHTRTDLVMNALREMHLVPNESARDTGLPIVLTPRQLIMLGLRTMHEISRVQEWEIPHFCGFAATPWWRASGDGQLICSNQWDLMLIDYAAVEHDGSVLDARGFDGEYIMRTITGLETIHFVRDSDAFHFIGWNSYPPPTIRPHKFNNFGKGLTFRILALNRAWNFFQRELLFIPTFVHAGALSDEWNAIEEKALRTMATWLDAPVDIERYSIKLPPHLQTCSGLQARIVACRLPWWRRNRLTWGVVVYLIVPIAKLWMLTNAFLNSVPYAFRRVMLALRGDAASVERLRWHGRRFLAKALGRPFG
jgi:hypothetical protein